MCHSCHSYIDHFGRPLTRMAVRTPGMGQFHGRHGYDSCIHPILPADLYNTPPPTCGKPQHTDDVHADTWRLLVGGNSYG